MKRLSPASALVLLAAFAVAALPARAQFGTAAFPRAVEVAAAPSGSAAQPLTLTVYPFSAFIVDYPSGSATKYGVLAAVEKAFPAQTGRSATVMGGWLWFGGDRGIYELHAKHYFTPEVGIQAGVIGATKTSGFVGDVFAIYNLDGRRVSASSRDWSMQFGAGLHGGQSAGFTGFVQASVNLNSTWSLNASYWYIRETPFDFNRFAVGAGIRF